MNNIIYIIIILKIIIIYYIENMYNIIDIINNYKNLVEVGHFTVRGVTVKWNTVYMVLKFKNAVKREVENVK